MKILKVTIIIVSILALNLRMTEIKCLNMEANYKAAFCEIKDIDLMNI